MSLPAFKTTAFAAVLLVGSASGALAATYAYVDHDSKVRANHYNTSSTVNYVEEGDVVKVIGHWGTWYKIEIPGPNGWVKGSVLEFDYEDDPSEPGVQFCFGGPFGQVCVNQ